MRDFTHNIQTSKYAPQTCGGERAKLWLPYIHVIRKISVWFFPTLHLHNILCRFRLTGIFLQITKWLSIIYINCLYTTLYENVFANVLGFYLVTWSVLWLRIGSWHVCTQNKAYRYNHTLSHFRKIDYCCHEISTLKQQYKVNFVSDIIISWLSLNILGKFTKKTWIVLFTVGRALSCIQRAVYFIL